MSTAAKQLKGRAARLAGLMPSRPSSAARTPFVLLVVVLLGGGLITLLLLNSALNQGSFKLSELKRKTTELTDEQQELQRDVDGFSAPDALERRARELGMVPGGSPAFLDPDGTVRGVPRRATGQPIPVPSPLDVPDPATPAPSPSPTQALAATPSTPAAMPSADSSPATPPPAPPPSAAPQSQQSAPAGQPAPAAPTAAAEPSSPPAKPNPTTPGR
ncbi:septum formation initiator family protein [Streptomyces sp. NPDC002870]|uniref:FtsB family cell division protein n=1 Tax=Streptomyces sp. NPDC002870 TaxID=3364666 RepID=UPI0036D0CEBA